SSAGYSVIPPGEPAPPIRALSVNSPLVDLSPYRAAFGGPKFAQNPPPITLAEVDAIPDAEFPPAMKLSFKSACRRFGVHSFAAWLARLKDFTAAGRLANIGCPTLAMAGEGEGEETRAQFERYCREVKGAVTRRMFSAEEGRHKHCQV